MWDSLTRDGTMEPVLPEVEGRSPNHWTSRKFPGSSLFKLKAQFKNMSLKDELKQRSPTFLAPGTSFVEDNFSADGGASGKVQAVMRAMGSRR